VPNIYIVIPTDEVDPNQVGVYSSKDKAIEMLEAMRGAGIKVALSVNTVEVDTNQMIHEHKYTSVA